MFSGDIESVICLQIHVVRVEYDPCAKRHRKPVISENDTFSWCRISLQVSSSKTSFAVFVTRPDLAPIEPESTLLTSSLTLNCSLMSLDSHVS